MGLVFSTFLGSSLLRAIDFSKNEIIFILGLGLGLIFVLFLFFSLFPVFSAFIAVLLVVISDELVDSSLDLINLLLNLLLGCVDLLLMLLKIDSEFFLGDFSLLEPSSDIELLWVLFELNSSDNSEKGNVNEFHCVLNYGSFVKKRFCCF